MRGIVSGDIVKQYLEKIIRIDYGTNFTLAGFQLVTLLVKASLSSTVSTFM